MRKAIKSAWEQSFDVTEALSDYVDRNFLRIMAGLCTAIVLGLWVGIANAGLTRSIRQDEGIRSPDFFAETGQQWDAITTVTPGEGVAGVQVPFLLNIGGGVKAYNLCLSENGYGWLTTGTCPPTTNNMLSPANPIWSNQLDMLSMVAGPGLLDCLAFIGIGRYDPTPPYNLGEAVPAVLLSWYDLAVVGQEDTDYSGQVVVTDRGNGDFGVYFVSGLTYDGATYIPTGKQGFKLGSAAFTKPITESGAAHNAFCFRSAKAYDC